MARKITRKAAYVRARALLLAKTSSQQRATWQKGLGVAKQVRNSVISRSTKPAPYPMGFAKFARVGAQYGKGQRTRMVNARRALKLASASAQASRARFNAKVKAQRRTNAKRRQAAIRGTAKNRAQRQAVKDRRQRVLSRMVANRKPVRQNALLRARIASKRASAVNAAKRTAKLNARANLKIRLAKSNPMVKAIASALRSSSSAKTKGTVETKRMTGRVRSSVTQVKRGKGIVKPKVATKAGGKSSSSGSSSAL